MILDFWSHFWFQVKTEIQVGYFRIAFLFFTFLYYFLKLFDLQFLYSSNSIVQLTDLDVLIKPENRFPFFVFPEGDVGIQLMFGFLFLGLIIGIIGILPRIFFLVLLFLHLLFLHRNPAVVYGADMLISVGLFGLSFMGCGESLLFKANRKGLFFENLKEDLSSLGLRLVQIQVSLIYCFTALEKVRGESWWSGTALWEVFNNQQMRVVDLTFMKAFPVSLVLLTWLVIIFELTFSLAVWTRAKNIFLILGMFFHFIIAAVMGLWFFSFLMVSFYLLFLDNPNDELNDFSLN